MKYLGMISYGLTIVGILLLAASVVADLSQLWILSGTLLIIAGVVKIAVIQIWQRVAGL